MSNNQSSKLGLALGTVAACGAITSIAYLIAKKRPLNLFVVDESCSASGSDILTHMPAEMFLSQFTLPAGLTLVCDKCVVSDRGVTGVLTRCEMSGIYQVFNGKTIASIDQDFAAGAAEIYPVAAPKEDGEGADDTDTEVADATPNDKK